MEKLFKWPLKKKKTSKNFFILRFGFVEFADIRNAEEALQENDKEFMGR